MRTFDPRNEFTPLFVSGVGQPSIDGDIYPAAATQLPVLPVDLLRGFNSGEVKMSPPKGIPAGALAFFSKYLGREAASGILRQYGAHPKDVDLIADACLRCQSLRYAKRAAARAGSQVHFFVYDNPHGTSVHGAELPAVFGGADEVKLEGAVLETPEALVRRTQRIWTDFAKGGNLSEEAALFWPQIQTGGISLPAMRMGEKMSLMEMTTARCSAWEAAETAAGGLVTARMCNEVMV
jgi:hypothetical protein